MCSDLHCQCYVIFIRFECCILLLLLSKPVHHGSRDFVMGSCGSWILIFFSSFIFPDPDVSFIFKVRSVVRFGDLGFFCFIVASGELGSGFFAL